MLLATAALVVCVLFVEVAFKAYQYVQRLGPPLHIVTDSPALYELNPDHPEINSQGLRDDDVSVPKPDGEQRILILGDSVAYGLGVPMSETFAARLQDHLMDEFGPVDVVNTSVNGYTSYNQLQYYLAKGRTFEPDVVVVAFCMNDVVNPRLHWTYTYDDLGEIPPEAIPNHDYDERHAKPLQAERRRAAQSLRRQSVFYRVLESSVWSLLRGGDAGPPGVPTHITGEDTLSIEVLLDDSSPEWQWLTSIYDQLREAVEADGARLAIVWLPLAYQLDASYPYMPQQRLMDYCRANSIPCLDLRPPLAEYSAPEVFHMRAEGPEDIWHLTTLGHEVAAAGISSFLQDSGVLTSR
jgi:hypothetical protein